MEGVLNTSLDRRMQPHMNRLHEKMFVSKNPEELSFTFTQLIKTMSYYYCSYSIS